MKYPEPLTEAILLKRYKRFLVDVRLADGSEITLHCPNTGSMKNCLYPGKQVWFSTSDNPKRKYASTWELAEDDNGNLIGINTGRANALAEEAIASGLIKELSHYSSIRREVKYGSENSRIDLLLSADNSPDCYIEVKSCTLLEGKQGFFPDAVSARGQKHLRELMEMVRLGHRAVLLFVVQHQGIKAVAPADHIDAQYGILLRQAIDVGVEVLAYGCEMDNEGLILSIPLAFAADKPEKSA
ncbi:DNA/RNA nuclease SfsA [Shewanella sp. JM162201]|uniref:Sugar fermentation stimulation protein homolog n=1 Tax=Shewanella jiangmenensis TaxID=2837387 RepID=A0ABS5V3K4_9GAMM|nr:DNA/RNA nuclease SfsA [Shewanella jiangmenensis]MBT1444407.1 DNA/RNA nuclease SfsA [Shewanella jiangmenensis]